MLNQNPSVSKSNHVHVMIFSLAFTPFIIFEVCSIDSSKMIGNFPTKP